MKLGIKIGSLRRSRVALFFFIIFYLIFGVLVSYYQESIIYLPNSQDFAHCPGLEGAQNLTSNGTRLYFKEVGQKIVVIYHGNAGSACDRAYLASFFENAGYSYVVTEYTGYSNDKTPPSHAAIKADVRHTIDFIEKHGFTDVTVFGESIGTGVASYHISQKPPTSVILVSPFTNLIDVARNRFWYYPVSLLVTNAFDNEELLTLYHGRLLILHGTEDSIIPTQLGKRLFEKVNTPNKKLVLIEGAGHNTMYEFPDTIASMEEFIR